MKHPFYRFFLPLARLHACVLVCVMLASCASHFERPDLPDTPVVDQLTRLAPPSNAIGLAPNDDSDDDAIYTPSSTDLIPTALEDTEPLPFYNVPRLSFSSTPLQELLQAVIADADLGLSVVWDSPASKISRSSVSMRNLSGDLTQVLNRLAQSYGFYWRYKDGMIYISADRQYIAPVPPIADLYESLPIMVKTLGGTDVFLDKSARMITFRAGSTSFVKIKNYLDVLRKNRSLIVYDTFIWEVVLNDASKMGVDWGALPGASPATRMVAGGGADPSITDTLTAGLVNATSGGNALSLSFAGSRFSMDLLIDFLRSQGTVNSLSQPKIQLLSGGKATLNDEISTTYVSKIGTSSIASGTVIPGAVETSQVKTGVALDITGDVSDGTIFSDIALSVSNVVSLKETKVNDVQITLPVTASRNLKTHVRAKPGDTILLAGIQYDKINSALVSGMGVVRSNQKAVERSELIIVMRPQIKHFVARDDKEGASPANTPAVAAPSTQYLAPLEIDDMSDLPPVTPDPATAAPVEIPVRTSDNLAPKGLFLQLGAFANAANAERFRVDLDQRMGSRKDQGQTFRVVSSAQPSEGVLHRVVLGPFADRTAARKWSGQLKKVGGEQPVLLRY
jgi:cell division septation protein DedD